jgi:two-component system, OmpR family, response regulator RstA
MSRAGDLAARIVLVEDDLKLAESVRDYLESEGMAVTIESRGDRACAVILKENPDLVLLDLMLPGMDGLAVCRALRHEYTGRIVMLTARGEELDEIVGLEVGADDYIAKPVRPRVLLARIRALLRRTEGSSLGSALALLRQGALEINPANRSVTMGGKEVQLSTAEFDLLYYFAEHAGQTITREQLYKDIRGIEYDGLDRSIDVRVSRLRQKLGDDPGNPRLIKSVRGSGYLFAVGI